MTAYNTMEAFSKVSS